MNSYGKKLADNSIDQIMTVCMQKIAATSNPGLNAEPHFFSLADGGNNAFTMCLQVFVLAVFNVTDMVAIVYSEL